MGKRCRLLRVDQVAQRLNISARSVYRMLAAREIKAARIRGALRVTEESIDQYIERQVAVWLDENT